MPYNDRYYLRHRLEYHDWEKRLATDFFTHYGVDSVVDLGCGVGSYLDAAFDLKLSRIKGYELNFTSAFPHIPVHLHPFISARDVTIRFIEPPFDCSWSIEVGEHLEPSGTIPFVENLVNLSSRIIVVTCAPPGQRGTSHINLRPKEEWISLFVGFGVKFQPKEVEETLKRWAPLGAPQYILRNLMIFFK